MAPESGSDWMTATEAAQRLGISKARMSKMLADGTLVSRKGTLDRRVKMVQREDVEKLAAEARGHGRGESPKSEAAA